MSTRKNNTTPRGPRYSRREFLIRGGIVGAGALSLPAILSACGGGGSSETVTNTLYFENWPGYVDSETVALFTKESGIDFKYTEAYNDNNEYFAKVQPFLAKGKTIAPDIVAPTYWMAARWIQLGWVEKINMASIPNSKNLRKDLKSPSWDKNNEYQLPYQTGIAGIAYNSSITKRELKSVADLFDPAFKGQIGMLTEMRDTIGLLAMAEGIKLDEISSFDQVSAVFDKLEGAKKDGQIRSFTGNDYMDDLSAGNFAACVAWSGDVLQLQKDNPNIKFIVPEEGGTSWYDTMMVVKGSKHAEQAYKWMDYIYDPVNAARITASVQYFSPVNGVKEEMLKMGGDAARLAEDPLLFPTEESISRLQSWSALSESEEAKFDERFAAITGA